MGSFVQLPYRPYGQRIVVPSKINNKNAQWLMLQAQTILYGSASTSNVSDMRTKTYATFVVVLICRNSAFILKDWHRNTVVAVGRANLPVSSSRFGLFPELFRPQKSMKWQ